MGQVESKGNEKEAGYRKLRVGRNNSSASLAKSTAQTQTDSTPQNQQGKENQEKQEKQEGSKKSNFKRQSSLQFDRHSGRHFNRQSSLLSSLSERCRGRRDSFSSWPGWYHGWIKRSRVEQLLADGPQGLFLMRNSTDFPGDLTLCVSNNGAVSSYRVRRENNKFTIDNVQFFTEIEELVTFYKSENGGCVEKLEVGCGRDLSRDEVKALLEDKPPRKYGTKRQKREGIEMSEMLIINRE